MNFRMTFSSVRIGVIAGVCSDVKVIVVDARRHIARVTDQFTFRDRTMIKRPANAMRQQQLAVEREKTIAVIINRSQPKAASGIRFWNEPFFELNQRFGASYYDRQCSHNYTARPSSKITHPGIGIFALASLLASSCTNALISGCSAKCASVLA